MKKFKKSLLLSVILLLSIALAACGGSSSSSDSGGDSSSDSGSSNSGQKFEFNLGHVGPADPEHPWEKYALEFAKRIEEATDGQVKINTFPGSQLGGDREMIEGLQSGAIDMGLISTISIGNFDPRFQVWDLPYIFPTDNAKVDEILEGSFGQKIAEIGEENDLIFLGYFENGWRDMSNSKRPITSVDDLKGLKIRVVENKPSLKWFSDIGAIPTPMAWSEVYTSLQQGTIDGQDNGPVITYGSKIYEVNDYFTSTKHIYAPMPLVIGRSSWDKLPADIQEKMLEIGQEVAKEQRQFSRETTDVYLEKMRESGMEITELTEEALKGFRESAQATYDELAPEIGQDLIDEMLKFRE